MNNLNKAIVYLTSLDSKLKYKEDSFNIDTRGKILLIKKFVMEELAKIKELEDDK